MITLSNRLKAVTDMVAPCGVVADVGCDHCFTLMYLLENGKCQKAIGTDVKKGPLEKARQNINIYGYTDKIELRMGYGLSTIAENEAETLIITGMGGGLISDVLNNGLATAKSVSGLILQPQNDVCALRQNLHEKGFRILDESMVFELGKYYNVIKAVEGEEKYAEKAYYLYGKPLIHKKDAVLKSYLCALLSKNAKIAAALRSKESENCVLRLAEIERENTIIREVSECL